MKNFFKNIVLYFLTLEAKLVLKKHKPFIIGITGNIGKTTTKDIIYDVLSKNLKDKIVRKTEKSLNSEYGIPLTIIGQKTGWNNFFKWIFILLSGVLAIFKRSYPDILILEIGADKKDDISSIMKWLKIDIGIVTQFSKYLVHVENFNNDRSLLIREKRYLIEGVKSGGKIIYNSSCLDSSKMIQDAISEATLKNNINIISFGNKNSDYVIESIKNNLEQRLTEAVICKNIKSHSNLTASYNDDDRSLDYKFKIKCLNTWGNASIWTTLPAIIVGDIFNIKNEDSVIAIENNKRSAGRMNILNSQYGQIIIDDTYNASPLAMQNGLDVLGDIKLSNPKIQTVAVLSDMLELGEYSVSAHLDIGDCVIKNKIDVLIVVGVRAKNIKLRCLELGMPESKVFEYDNSKSAAKDINTYCKDNNIIKKGALVYIKGSQSMRMEKVVSAILDKSLDKQSVLVRQEAEWMKR